MVNEVGGCSSVNREIVLIDTRGWLLVCFAYYVLFRPEAGELWKKSTCAKYTWAPCFWFNSGLPAPSKLNNHAHIPDWKPELQIQPPVPHTHRIVAPKPFWMPCYLRMKGDLKAAGAAYEQWLETFSRWRDLFWQNRDDIDNRIRGPRPIIYLLYLVFVVREKKRKLFSRIIILRISFFGGRIVVSKFNERMAFYLHVCFW